MPDGIWTQHRIKASRYCCSPRLSNTRIYPFDWSFGTAFNPFDWLSEPLSTLLIGSLNRFQPFWLALWTAFNPFDWLSETLSVHHCAPMSLESRCPLSISSPTWGCSASILDYAESNSSSLNCTHFVLEMLVDNEPVVRKTGGDGESSTAFDI